MRIELINPVYSAILIYISNFLRILRSFNCMLCFSTFFKRNIMYTESKERRNVMRWELDINEKYKQTEITIRTSGRTDKVSKLMTFIEQLSHAIPVQQNEQQVNIDIYSIYYVENIERTTFIYTKTEMYEDNRPLYEIERLLAPFEFIRINKQTLINPRYIQSVKALFNSRYELLMKSGEKLIVTRHYRRDFKELFEEGGLYDA